MAKKIGREVRVRKTQCDSCVFRPVAEGGVELHEDRRCEIYANLASGGNQLCHHDRNKTVCRGGRDFQLHLLCERGLIKEPTDEALREAMRAAGIEPGGHV